MTERILRVAHDWADGLIDRTRRNQLLFCRDAGKLPLEKAPAAAQKALALGRPVRLRELFPDEQEYARAAKVVEAIRRRIREYDEERGVRVGRVAYAFASWEDHKDRTVRAPVLLRNVTVARTAKGFGDHEITADPDLEVNPVMLAHLAASFNVSIDPVLLDELNDQVDDPAQVEVALGRLRELFAGVPGFRIEPGLLLGTFHYAKLAMFDDLRANAEVYAANELFAAVAGDEAAITAVRRAPGEITRDQPDRIAPPDEFLVLDADPSQNYVINAALAGRNLVVQGPPGTGKSQTISNLISSLAARGKRVLFVAEKRAAIDAVLRRLDRAGLGSLVLDLHVTTANRAAAYQQFRDAIEVARRVPLVDQSDLHARLTRLRGTMVHHAEAMHAPLMPWGTTVFAAQAAMLGTPEEARTPSRLGRLDELHGVARDDVRDKLGRLVDADGVLPVDARGPWGSAVIDSPEAATRARDLVRSLRSDVPVARRTVTELASTVGAAAPSTMAEAAWLAELSHRTADSVARWRPEIWEQDLPRLLVATGDRAYRRAVSVRVGFFERWRLRRLAAGLRVAPGGSVHADVAEVASVRDGWSRLGIAAIPVVAPVDVSTVVSGLAALGALLRRPLDSLGWNELGSALDALAADPLGPVRAERARALSTELRARGLTELLDWLERSAVAWPSDGRRELVGAAFEHAWNASVLDEAKARDGALASFNARTHDASASAFVAADREHIGGAPQRILRSVAQRLVEVRSANPAQDLFLDKELTRKRKLKPVRDLVSAAPDVLLAAKPCWAMSPLLVSQMLPPTQLFDVVIFDEASQVQPAEAMPSLARGRTAVVAGDSRQLPPTVFFEEQTEAANEDEEALTSDVESILDAFNRALGQTLAHEFSLGWHYRSEDARLIAFSNHEFYDNRLTTFPGTAVSSPLQLVVANGSAAVGTGTSDAAVADEVARVVDLAVEHARTRPSDSLGIIALSLRHAERIATALRARVRELPELQPFFDENRDEACFVKNLERVQGDERDSIILSAGFGKVDGRLYRRFGPINLAGGERRLNVAITRARRSMTVVTSFEPSDLDPDSVTAEGAKAFARFVRYAASRGADRAAPGSSRPLNPFEISVRDRLVAAGLDVMAHWGVAGYYLDFAARHPARPDQMALAIEADGPSYYAAETSRARDRLRREHLERLGWRFHRIWSTEWFADPDRALAGVLTSYQQALATSDAEPEPEAENEPQAEVPAPIPARSGPRPAVVAGAPIAQHAEAALMALLEWIESDGVLRTNEELLREASRELGYARIGAQIRARLTAAIARLRSKAR